MEFSELKVYTITCTCTTDAPVDDLFDVVSNASVGGAVLECRPPSSPGSRGGFFGYHASFVVRPPGHPRPVHVKLFKNGSMQIAGALSSAAAHEAAEAAAKACGLPAPIDLVVRMINSGMRCTRRLNLLACRDAMRAAGLATAYDPVRYAAVKVSAFPNNPDLKCACSKSCVTKTSKQRWCPMTTVSIFESGAIGVCGGGATLDKLHDVANRVASILESAHGSAQEDCSEALARLLALA